MKKTILIVCVSILFIQCNNKTTISCNATVISNAFADSFNIIKGSSTFEAHKQNETSIFKYCKYTVAKIPNTQSVGEVINITNDSTNKAFAVSANDAYFKGMINQYAIIDRGTGNQRTLEVYDVEQQKKVFSSTYFNELSIDNNKQIVFWYKSEIVDVIKRPTCDSSYAKNGLTCGYLQQQMFNLITLQHIKTEKYACDWFE